MKSICIPLLFSLILTGCGGVIDVMVEPSVLKISPDIGLKDEAKITVLQVYSKSSLNSEDSLKVLLSDSVNPQRQVITSHKNTGEFSSFIRGGAFFIIPPIGSLLVDKGNYYLIRYINGDLYGLAVEPDGAVTRYSIKNGELTTLTSLDTPFDVVVSKEANKIVVLIKIKGA